MNFPKMRDILTRQKKVLILATSRKTRGGVTSVIKAHEQGEQWRRYHCKWVETHSDKNSAVRFLFFIKSFFSYLFLLPFYDLVHIHTSEPPSAARKATFMFLAKLLRKKSIIHFHSFSPETTINSRYKKIYKYLFSQADCILVLSEYWKREISQTFVLSEKINVLYNPSEKPDLSTKYEKTNRILYAGAINARKGYADLIKAFAKIANRFPEWKIVFAGNGEIEKAKILAKEFNIEKQTEFLGWVSGENKSKIFQEASVFCLPSYAEGLPMAVLDAWAYELPVITTPVGGIPDIVEDDINGIFFDAGNIDKLSQKLEMMIVDENLRNNIMLQSKKLSDTKFNVNVVNKQLEIIYHSLLYQKDMTLNKNLLKCSK